MTRWMGLCLRVLHRQMAGDLCELKGGSIGRRECEMPARLRLYGTENIGRTAPLVLVIPPRFPSRFGRRGHFRPGFLAGGEGSRTGHSFVEDLFSTASTRQERRDPNQRSGVGNQATIGAGSRGACRRSWAPAMGHRKHGFNELVEGWHADHAFKHDAAAIECFPLMKFLAFTLFHAFLYLNVKPPLR
jgi:hypothetical protein